MIILAILQKRGKYVFSVYFFTPRYRGFLEHYLENKANAVQSYVITMYHVTG